jgi:hypothetical protein
MPLPPPPSPPQPPKTPPPPPIQVSTLAPGSGADDVQAAWDLTRDPDLAGRPFTLKLPGGAFDLGSALLFDSGTTVAEVFLVGDGMSELMLSDRRRRRLARGQDGLPVIQIGEGAPIVNLINLTFRDPLLVTGGEVTVQACTFGGATQGRLFVEGGSAVVHDTVFQGAGDESILGGAVVVRGGDLSLVGCLLAGNTALDGGAMYIMGGVTKAYRTTIERNRAVRHGGGVFLGNISNVFHLHDRTLLQANSASGGEAAGRTVYINRLGSWGWGEFGFVKFGYFLPTPAGRFLSPSWNQGLGCRERILKAFTSPPHTVYRGEYAECNVCNVDHERSAARDELSSQLPYIPLHEDHLEADFPPECNRGYYGNATILNARERIEPTPEELEEVRIFMNTNGVPGSDPMEIATLLGWCKQTTGRCCGLCSAGFRCPSGTVQPLECAAGEYCIAGTGEADKCPAGTFSDVVRSETDDDCQICPPGYYCPAGSAQALPCSPGKHQAASGRAECNDCVAGKVQSLEGQAACDDCPIGHYCEARSAAPTPCSASRKTTSSGKASIVDCVCMERFYDPRIDQVTCIECPAGSNCTCLDETLETLPLMKGYWRNTTVPETVIECPDIGAQSGCAGTASGALCKAGLDGPYCKVCTDNKTYYESSTSECKACADGLHNFSSAIAGVLGGIAGAILIWLSIKKFFPEHLYAVQQSEAMKKLQRRLRVFLIEMKPRLITKLKLCVGFYQVATKVESVYRVNFPPAASSSLASFNFVNLNLQTFLPISCFASASPFKAQLDVFILSPMVFFLIIVLVTEIVMGIKEPLRGPEWKSRLRHHLLVAGRPVLLITTFMIAPGSVAASSALDCECLPNDWSYLRVDYSVICGECDYRDNPLLLANATAGFEEIRGRSGVIFALYVIGIPLLYGVLFFVARKDLMPKPGETEADTEERLRNAGGLAQLLRPLYREFEPYFFWWELLVIVQKLLLVCFLSLTNPGSLLQLLLAIVVVLAALAVQTQAAPYKYAEDDFLSFFTMLSLVALFVCRIS